jgi:aryl-alcohol dehydrogenase-like predicted oxidoreductase
MKYRTLGKTGIVVSEVGFGCGNVGGLMIRGSEEERVNAVKRAVELGVNYFDTAVQYGNGQSETNLGKVLAVLKPAVHIATKFSINEEDIGDIKGAAQSSLEGSLERLKMDSVDVLQLHTPVVSGRANSVRRWSVTEAEVLGKNGIADALDYLRSQGLVRYIGFTGIGETDALHRVTASDRFDLVQSYYNLLNPSSGTAVPAGFKGYNFRQLIGLAASRDMGVVVIRVMAGGALGGKAARSGYASQNIGGAIIAGADYRKDEERAGKLDFLVKDDITGLPQAAVKFALMHPGVSTVLVGYSDIGQIEEAAGCPDKKDIPGDSMERMMKLWSVDFGV